MGNKIGRRRQVVDDKYTRPQGLYQHPDIDQRKLRKLILESKLAPCYPGNDERALDLEECPICFLYYPSLNRSRCCTKGICTECFLQMKPPHATRSAQCPFCKTSNYAVEYRGVKTKEEKGMEEVEEQKVIEAQIRIRKQEIMDEEERLKKRQDTSSWSRIMNPAEVEYHAPSFKYTTQNNEFVSSQASCSVPAGSMPLYARQNRACSFDHNRENIMVMDSIWLSIQEHGHQEYPAYLGSFLSGSSFSEGCYSSHGITPVVPPYGDVAAAVTDHQHINIESSASVAGITTSVPVFDILYQSSCISAGNMRCIQNGPWCWNEIPPDIVRATQRQEIGECSTDRWSAMAGAGGSNVGCNMTIDPRTAITPFPNGAIVTPGHLVPESFEEQMIMLAMSASLADTRARM